MFISRKKYEADLEKAFQDGRESVFEQRRMDDCMREVHIRMDEVCKRLSRMEEAHRPVKVCPTEEEVTFTACSPCRCF
ncbi:MAG: hypothetical protein IJN44_11610 [Clostridia bacterium]|nr:hypothetical protein [Clostridia bacterium]